MKINTTEFKKALDVVKPALASKEIIEQTTSFAFIDDCVVTYNDEICIMQPLTGVKIDGVIKADELYKFLGKVKEKEFDITVTENEVLMKAGRAKVGFALNTNVLLPLTEVVTERSEWKTLPKDFLHACKFAASSASSDMSDPKLTCVHMTKEGVVEASNNHRLVIWRLPKQLPMPEILIPATSVREVVKIVPTMVSTGSGWIHFKNTEGTIISCRTFDEAYVNTESIMKTLGKGKKIIFPDGLVTILEKAEIFSLEQKINSSVTLDFKDGKILVKSESTTAWFKETIGYDGEEQFSFSITPYLLKDILKQTNECFITKSTLKFEGEQWVYVTSLRTYNNE